VLSSGNCLLRVAKKEKNHLPEAVLVMGSGRNEAKKLQLQSF
jgi:hypothetical protein